MYNVKVKAWFNRTLRIYCSFCSLQNSHLLALDALGSPGGRNLYYFLRDFKACCTLFLDEVWCIGNISYEKGCVKPGGGLGGISGFRLRSCSLHMESDGLMVHLCVYWWRCNRKKYGNIWKAPSILILLILYNISPRHEYIYNILHKS